LAKVWNKSTLLCHKLLLLLLLRSCAAARLRTYTHNIYTKGQSLRQANALLQNKNKKKHTLVKTGCNRRKETQGAKELCLPRLSSKERVETEGEGAAKGAPEFKPRLNPCPDNPPSLHRE
jgi:hypothetical protein